MGNWELVIGNWELGIGTEILHHFQQQARCLFHKKINIFVEQAFCLFIKGLLRMVKYLSWSKKITYALCPMPYAPCPIYSILI
ncbi:hypothetical protein QUB57_18765 [Microcoleus sp. F6_C1]